MAGNFDQTPGDFEYYSPEYANLLTEAPLIVARFRELGTLAVAAVSQFGGRFAEITPAEDFTCMAVATVYNSRAQNPLSYVVTSPDRPSDPSRQFFLYEPDRFSGESIKRLPDTQLPSSAAPERLDKFLQHSGCAAENAPRLSLGTYTRDGVQRIWVHNDSPPAQRMGFLVGRAQEVLKPGERDIRTIRDFAVDALVAHITHAPGAQQTRFGLLPEEHGVLTPLEDFKGAIIYLGSANSELSDTDPVPIGYLLPKELFIPIDPQDRHIPAYALYLPGSADIFSPLVPGKGKIDEAGWQHADLSVRLDGSIVFRAHMSGTGIYIHSAYSDRTRSKEQAVALNQQSKITPLIGHNRAERFKKLERRRLQGPS